MLLMSASPALMAEWVPIDDGKDAVVYVDYSTIQRSGNKIKVWSLGDHKSIQDSIAGPYLSLKFLLELDCIERLERVISVIAYSAHMGAGEVIGSITNNSAQWEYLVVGTEGWAQYKEFCLMERESK